MRTLKTCLTQSGASPHVRHAILTIANICSQISGQIREGALAGIHGEAGTGNVQGEQQKKLDVIANDLFVEGLAGAMAVSGLASEEMEHSVDIPGGAPLLAAFDPLDGSSNIDVNISVGSIFSILPAPSEGTPTQDAQFLRPGREQVAAGYVLYGPSTELVFSVGEGLQRFTLSGVNNEWLQVGSDIKIPEATQEFAINTSNARHWYTPIREYVDELILGASGPRMKNFNMRWVASMVADVHRILCRGGVFLYPADQREPDKPGKLRLLYEANPMAFLVEQASGLASNGEVRILDIQPTALHQRVAVVLGSKEEVVRVSKLSEG